MQAAFSVTTPLVFPFSPSWLLADLGHKNLSNMFESHRYSIVGLTGTTANVIYWLQGCAMVVASLQFPAQLNVAEAGSA